MRNETIVKQYIKEPMLLERKINLSYETKLKFKNKAYICKWVKKENEDVFWKHSKNDCSCKELQKKKHGEKYQAIQFIRILCIQSHVINGYVGTDAFILPLQLEGFHVSQLLSSVYVDMYTHKGWTLSLSEFRVFLDHLFLPLRKKNNFCDDRKNSECSATESYGIKSFRIQCDNRRNNKNGGASDANDKDGAFNETQYVDNDEETHFFDLETHLENPPDFPYSYIVSGFVGTPEVLKHLAMWLRTLEKYLIRRKGSCIYFLDPVVGDRDEIYVNPNCIDIYAHDLLPCADIFTPNKYEAEWILWSLKSKEKERESKMNLHFHVDSSGKSSKKDTASASDDKHTVKSQNEQTTRKGEYCMSKKIANVSRNIYNIKYTNNSLGNTKENSEKNEEATSDDKSNKVVPSEARLNKRIKRNSEANEENLENKCVRYSIDCRENPKIRDASDLACHFNCNDQKMKTHESSKSNKYTKMKDSVAGLTKRTRREKKIEKELSVNECKIANEGGEGKDVANEIGKVNIKTIYDAIESVNIFHSSGPEIVVITSLPFLKDHFCELISLGYDRNLLYHHLCHMDEYQEGKCTSAPASSSSPLMSKRVSFRSSLLALDLDLQFENKEFLYLIASRRKNQNKKCSHKPLGEGKKISRRDRSENVKNFSDISCMRVHTCRKCVIPFGEGAQNTKDCDCTCNEALETKGRCICEDFRVNIDEKEDDNCLYIVIFQKQKCYLGGTGDLFAALLLSRLHRYRFHLLRAILTSLYITQKVIRQSVKYSQFGTVDPVSAREFFMEDAKCTCKSYDIRDNNECASENSSKSSQNHSKNDEGNYEFLILSPHQGALSKLENMSTGAHACGHA